MALLHEEDAHNYGVTRRRGQTLVGNEKAHLTGEFVIVAAKFGGHVLRHLVSSLSNVIRQMKISS